MKKHKCEVRWQVVCKNECVRHMTGIKKGDPKFFCCIACAAYLRRQGVRLKEAQEKTKGK